MLALSRDDLGIVGDTNLDDQDMDFSSSSGSSSSWPPPNVYEKNDCTEPARPVPEVLKLDNWNKYWTWSNDVKDIDIRTSFKPNLPNMAEAYGLDGLQPIIREKGGDLHLLVDAQKNYYEWDYFNRRCFGWTRSSPQRSRPLKRLWVIET